MKTAKNERHFLFVLLIATFVFALAIFYPFLTTLVLSAAFAVVLRPVYQWIKKRITKGVSSLASMTTIILFIILLCGPIFFIGKIVFHQTESMYRFVANTENPSNFIQKVDTSINKLIPDGFSFDTHGKIKELVSYITSNVADYFASTFQVIILFMLMIIILYYLLKDGDKWKQTFISLCPMSEENTHEILRKLNSLINRILKGSFLIAIIQGALVGLGLYVFGVPNPALFGVVAGIASFIPTFGTSIVTVPAIIFLLATGLPIYALGLLIWSILLVGLVDNALTPYFISKNTDIPSIFILLAILGGISLMGPIGILIGPLVLSLLYSLIEIYRKESKID